MMKVITYLSSTTLRAPREYIGTRTSYYDWHAPVLVAIACSLGWLVASERWLLVAGVFALLLLIARPIEAALGLYAFLIPFESMATLEYSAGPTATLLRYVGLLALFVCMAVGWLSDRIIRPPRVAIYWSLLVLWSGVTSVWAIDQEKSLKRLPTALGLWLLYMAIVSVRLTAKEFSSVVLLTILGGLGASAYSGLTFLRTGGAIGRVSLAEGSSLSDPNFFAVALLLPLSLSFGGVLSSRTWPRRTMFLTVTGLIAFAVFLTMSRGALAAAAAIASTFILRLRLNWRLILPVAATGTALMFMPRLFFERMQEVSATRMAGREDIWLVGIHSLKSYGLFGAGLDNFSDAFERYVGTSRFSVGDQRASHNIYLTIAVEFGILGTILFFRAMRSHMGSFRTANIGSLSSPRLVAFEAACWGMLVAGFGVDIIWRKAFWFVWALSAAAVHLCREQVADSIAGSARAV